MQTEKTMNTSTNASAPGFDQMAVGLKSAITDFQETQSPEALAGIIAALKPIGDFGLRLWGMTSGFVRRHPVQTAVGVVALGTLAAYLLKPRTTPALDSKRNY
jgi:hypothetical protein